MNSDGIFGREICMWPGTGGENSTGATWRCVISSSRRATTFPLPLRASVRSILVIVACVLAACGRAEQASAPEQGHQTQLLPGQAPPIRPVELAIPASFDEAGMFADGLAPVRVGGKFGYIDTRG